MNYFSNEIVFRGHPDKVCDQISGAILTELLKHDPYSRVGIECSIKNNKLWIFGEITTNAKVNYKAVARSVLRDIGYPEKFSIKCEISHQSHDIDLGTNEETGGAGDQGMMFGYACDATSAYLPVAQVILQELAEWYDHARSKYSDLLPDGKAQITGIYDDDFNLVRIETFTISYQNKEKNRRKTDAIIRGAALGICNLHNISVDKWLINPTGAFCIGGPYADAGLTGRKIVVDAYQSFANVGGGCLNGKDPTKVDVSGAYKARELAIRFLKKKHLKWCEVQISYAIGIPEPLAIYARSNLGSFPVPKSVYSECVPARIIKDLKLKDLNWYNQAMYGHFK